MKAKFKTGDKITNECCGCGLQHIWLFKIVRGKTPEDDIAEMDIFQDKPAGDNRSTSDKVNAQRDKLKPFVR